MPKIVFDVPHNSTFETYRDAKLEILRRDFKITLTEEETTKTRELRTEIQVDQFFLGAISKRWN